LIPSFFCFGLFLAAFISIFMIAFALLFDYFFCCFIQEEERKIIKNPDF